MARKFIPYSKGKPITANTDKISVEGHIGKWYVINETVHNGKTVFLLEHEEYGDEVSAIAVDVDCNIVCEDIYDDFPECLDY
jgi:hypothetical protein